MWDDVVNNCCRSNASLSLTLCTQRMICEERQTSTSPGVSVPSFCAGYSVSIFVPIGLSLMLRAISLTLMNESFTAWIVAEMEWHGVGAGNVAPSSRYYSNESSNKKPSLLELGILSFLLGTPKVARGRLLSQRTH